eukprot:3941094-Rhodomonas_salina.1
MGAANPPFKPPLRLVPQHHTLAQSTAHTIAPTTHIVAPHASSVPHTAQRAYAISVRTRAACARTPFPSAVAQCSPLASHPSAHPHNPLSIHSYDPRSAHPYDHIPVLTHENPTPHLPL